MRCLGLVLAFALLAAGCGGSPKNSASTANDAVAFSGCMRSNGVSSYPDPGTNGVTPKESLQQLGASGARFAAAERSCRHLLPNGGRPPSQVQRQQTRAQALSFARCVRAHGVPTFPDPGNDGRIPDHGFDQASPAFRAANDACARYRPPYIPSNSAYDAWAQTHTNGSGG